MIFNQMQNKKLYVGFPDFSKLIKSFANNTTWIATEDCWIIGYSYYNLKVNGIDVIEHPLSVSATHLAFQIPVKKGDSIYFTTNASTGGSAKAYSMRR